MLLKNFCGQRIEDRTQEKNLATFSNSDDVPTLGVLRRWLKLKDQDGKLLATKDAISHVSLALRILAWTGRVRSHVKLLSGKLLYLCLMRCIIGEGPLDWEGLPLSCQLLLSLSPS